MTLKRHDADFERDKTEFCSAEKEQDDERLAELLQRVDPHAYNITRHNPKKFKTFLTSYFKHGKPIKGTGCHKTFLTGEIYFIYYQF